jgi:hypothetical protein
MLKYGKIALFDGLSGSSGQVASPYGATAEELPALPLPVAIAALVDAESIPETMSAPSAPRRRGSRPASAVGADEAVV